MYSSSSSSSDPSLVKNPLRSSAAIYMYVTESIIKFLPLFAMCVIQQVSGFDTCKAFTCVRTAL